jgi:alkylation response protein AidB-like acyl-CoA dehydrogenase
MKEAGIFRMAMPQEWGGPELNPLMQLRVIEALARADGSVGWCAMINSDGGYFSAFLDDGVARGMYRDLDAPSGSSLVFSGRAVRADGGYRVSGRWPFVSGCQHCDWVLLTCQVYEGDSARIADHGHPERCACFVPSTDFEVLDTWYTTGLRGSGSHDVEVSNVFVPAEHTCKFPLEPHRQGALYAYPLMFAYNLPAVTLGIARGAIDTFVEIAERKQLTTGMLTGRKMMLRDESYVQSTVGRAEAMVTSARHFVYGQLEDIWNTLLVGDQPSLKQRALYRLAITHTHAVCAEAVEMLYKAYGGSAVYSSGPFDRHLRDVLTVNQHTISSPRIYEAAGRVLLGLDHREPIF